MASDTYAGTRAQALQAQTDALVADVAYGIAGAALIATVVSLIFDIRAPAEAPAVEAAPAPAPGGGGGVVVRGHF
jgi:hypothetical protein